MAGRYGYRRVTMQLHKQGIKINHKVVMRLMKEENKNKVDKNSATKILEKDETIKENKTDNLQQNVQEPKVGSIELKEEPIEQQDETREIVEVEYKEKKERTNY